jgi:beta-lactamase regulating signal transducer with metallopeptidase domain
MMIASNAQVFAEMFAVRMLNAAAEGIVIALFGWVLLRALGRQNSSTRFAIWSTTLTAVVALAIAEGFRSSAVPAQAAHTAIQLPGYWAVAFFSIWVLIAFVSLAKIAFGFWQLRSLRSKCELVDTATLDPALLKTLAQFDSRRTVSIFKSRQVRVPTAIGFLKPAVVIPTWALNELTVSELNAVLLHELAHLRRWDDWTNLAQRIVSAVLFFHPAVWWIGRGLAREREMACDDYVLAATSDRRGYAQCLVSVAEKSFLRRGLALAQALAGKMKLTTQRVSRILDVSQSGLGKEPQAIKVWKPALGLMAAFSAVCLVLLPHASNLVAFDESLPTSTTFAAAEFSPHFDAQLGAKTIPAKFITSVANANFSRKNAVAHPAKTHNIRNNDHILAASTASRSMTPQPPDPQVINASAKDSTSAMQTHAVLVMMQSEQIDENGQIEIFCVWRLTVYHPSEKNMQQILGKGITPKST